MGSFLIESTERGRTTLLLQDAMMHITTPEGLVVGRLLWQEGALSFDGNLAASAREFMEAMVTEVGEILETIPRNALEAELERRDKEGARVMANEQAVRISSDGQMAAGLAAAMGPTVAEHLDAIHQIDGKRDNDQEAQDIAVAVGLFAADKLKRVEEELRNGR